MGGGNHFIEANRDEEGSLYIVIHSGSRHLGLQIANFYQNAGYKALTTRYEEDVQKLVRELKSEGRASDIETSLREMKPRNSSIP